MSDLSTVWRKEILEAMATPRIRRQAISSLLIVSLLVDVSTIGGSSGFGAGSFSFFVFFPLVMGPVFIAADSFAGERERHTLETLLASRLSDRSVVMGKLFAILSLAATGSAIILGQALVVMTVTGTPVQRVANMSLLVGAILAAGLIVSCLFTCIAIIVSMRAPTVQSAMQTTSYIMIPVMVVPAVLVPLVLFTSLPAGLISRVTPLGWWVFGGIAALVLVAVDAGLIALTVSLYRRERLMAK